jgi:hypothetical protein
MQAVQAPLLLNLLVVLLVARAGVRGRGPLARLGRTTGSPAIDRAVEPSLPLDAPGTAAWAWPAAFAAATLASGPLIAALPTLVRSDAQLPGDAATHAVVANALVTSGLPHGWVESYNGGFPFGIHYQSVGYLLVAALIRLGLPAPTAIQAVGVGALIALPFVVVHAGRRLGIRPELAALAALLVSWAAPATPFAGGWSQYLAKGMLAQALGLAVAMAFVTSILSRRPSWPVPLLGALLAATHPQLATGTLALLGLAIPFAPGAWVRRYALGVVAVGLWLVAIYGHGVTSLGIPFGFPSSMPGWYQTGFGLDQAESLLLEGKLYDRGRDPVVTPLWLLAAPWLLALARAPVARALLAVSFGGLALSFSGALLAQAGPIGAFLGAFLMPLRLMALLPLVLAASVVVVIDGLTAETAPRWMRWSLVGATVAALLVFALPERWAWARDQVAAREASRRGEGAECGQATPAGLSTERMASWVRELGEGRLAFDADPAIRNCMVMQGVELAATVPLGESSGAVTHVGTLVEAFKSLHPLRPGIDARAESLGVRHLLFSRADRSSEAESFRIVHQDGSVGLATRVGGTGTVGVGCIEETWTGGDKPLRTAIDEATHAQPGLLDHPKRLIAIERGAGAVVRRADGLAGCDASLARVDEIRREPGAYEATISSPHPVDVVVRATAYAGWRVRVDGGELPWRMVAPGFFAVRVPAGEHRMQAVVSLPRTYVPALVLLGMLTVVLSIGLARREGMLQPRGTSPRRASDAS